MATNCEYAECISSPIARGLCKNHYYRLRRSGRLPSTFLFERHGLTGTIEYHSWNMMKARCYNQNNPDYPNYGGRGIKVCEEWKSSFSNFLKDMGPRPGSYTLDRIDVNGNYEPRNCRWADYITQENNRTNNHMVSHEGRAMTVAQWAREADLKTNAVYKRLARGWDIFEALDITPRKNI